MKERIRDALTMPLLAALVVLADQASKRFVRANLTPGQSLDWAPWLGSLVRFTYVTNSGAAFGLFPGWSQVLIVVAVIVILALVWYYFHLSDGRWLVQLALGLQLGGAIGNLIDRLRFAGHVVDFIDLDFWPLRRWPVFNIADSSIVTGVTALALLMIWEEWRNASTGRRLATAPDD